MFLTAEELAELTGYVRQADQRRWLTKHRWIFEVSVTGRPVVSRKFAEERLSGASAPKSEPRLNLAVIRG